MMPLTAQDKEKILSFLESRLEPKAYDTWCRSLELEHAGDDIYRLPPATLFVCDLLVKLLSMPLEVAFSNLFGRTPDLVFQVHASAGYPAPPAPRAAAAPPPPPVEPAPVTPDFVYNPNYTFDNFI